jgi:hypothetical protein
MVGVLAIMTIISASLAYINIKRLQIDQHRAWMLRCVSILIGKMLPASADHIFHRL